jgi:OOP family OmpA-OmpF porin
MGKDFPGVITLSEMKLKKGKDMSRAKRFLQIGILLAGMVCTAAAASAAAMAESKLVEIRKTADNFIIMYDSSSSMGDRYGQTDMKEIDAEKKILKEKVMTLPELDWQAGIYTFTPNWSTSYFKPFLSTRTYNKNEFLEVIEKLPDTPAGYTPLQGGLTGLGKELESLQGKTVVFLFTDGQYTPQSGFHSPGMIAKEIAAKNDVCFKVIATSENKAQYKAIKNIASVNECSSIVPFDSLLGHPDWLTDALFNVVEMDVVVKKSGNKEVVIVGVALENVLFPFDKSDITDQGAKALLELSIVMQENPQTSAVLAGFTDNVGSQEYNLELSKRRAESARTYLIKNGLISPDRITVSWFGKGDPTATNDTEAGRAKNRRVTAIITGL